MNFVIVERGLIVGCMDLVPVNPPSYGSGFFLAVDACGRGMATLSLGALLAHARSGLGAAEVFGGVTHGNRRSVAVLERVGYRFVADMGGYDRYRVDLNTWNQIAGERRPAPDSPE